ncbi:NADPH:quinone reductase [Goodfellowiella coeruleoviolacea]|uniref:NADPH:quinone reductase n=2 Tax=Goodfellowiella coeruleoviolacea TaxID=334858 RepID=A0AAE3GK62_9PSEU|nr:NADPH:quinone reductase [Goodfellowiella coeruleoviolacea]
MNEMRAARFDRFGPPEVLYEGRAPVPVPTPDQVLVRVHAASVNGGEVYFRAGRLPVPFGRRPKATGLDFAGEVVALGAAAAGRPGPRVGDRVWGGLPRRFGSAAEFVAVHPRQLALSPAGVDLVQAAALPGVGSTAIIALRDKARLRPGERLLVRGGSGGVGSAAVQLGHAFGAHVTALASGRNLDFVRDLGADEVVDYRATRPAELGRFDVVLDTVGTDLPAYRRLLAPGGRMVAIAFDINRILSSVGYLLASSAFGPRRARFFAGNPTHRLFADLTGYVESGAIRPIVDTVYPLADIAEAHRRLEAGGVRGKIVLRVIDPPSDSA